MHWWDWLAAPALMLCNKGDGHVSSTSPNQQAMTNYRAGVSGTGNRIIPRWQPNKKREKDIYHRGSRPISIICHLPNPPYFSLVGTFNVSFKNLRVSYCNLSNL
jgi:hypothetical protein